MTASRWRSKPGRRHPRVRARAHCSRTQGRVRRQLVQLIVVPPPSVVPATRLTLPSAVGVGPAPPEHLLVGRQLELGEVGLVVVAGGLEHDDVEAALRQHGRDDGAAGARADDADVGLEGLLGALAARGSSAASSTCGGGEIGPGIAEGLPVGVLAGLRGRARRR